jgi:hypothetical protein
MFKEGGIGNHGILSIKHKLYMAYLLMIWRTSSINWSVAGVLLSFPNCGNAFVPYPLSTKDGCSQDTLIQHNEMIEPNRLLLHLYLYLNPMLLVCPHIDQKPIHRSITISRINLVFPCYLCQISC